MNTGEILLSRSSIFCTQAKSIIFRNKCRNLNYRRTLLLQFVITTTANCSYAINKERLKNKMLWISGSFFSTVFAQVILQKENILHRRWLKFACWLICHFTKFFDTKIDTSQWKLLDYPPRKAPIYPSRKLPRERDVLPKIHWFCGLATQTHKIVIPAMRDYPLSELTKTYALVHGILSRVAH